MKFYIPKGKQWARPWHKRTLYSWTPPFTSRTKQTWRAKVDFRGCPAGTSIKLCGFAEVRPFSYNREHISHVTHEDSDRITCVWDGRKISVGAYGYRNGEGGVTGTSKYMKPLCDVANNAEFHTTIEVKPNRTVYSAQTTRRGVDLAEGEVLMERSSRSWLRWWTFAHASGNHGDVAPARIDIELERV